MNENPVKATIDTCSSAASLANHKSTGETTAPSTSSEVCSVTSHPTRNKGLSAERGNPHFITNFDVALYREKVKGTNNTQICSLIRNVFKPDSQHSFPKTNGRSFRYDWLKSYPWLCYSPGEDGAFCL